MAYFNKIYPTSNITTSVNVPEAFGITRLTTNDNTLVLGKDFELKQDVNGVFSILEFKVIPYIDYNKYDHDRRMWFNVDKYGTLWRKYVWGDYILEQDNKFIGSSFMGSSGKIYYSMYNLLKTIGTNIYEYWDENNVLFNTYVAPLNITEYKPIKIIVGGRELKDITDYSFNVAPRLDNVAPEKNMQFYFDKKNRIYTNIDFAFYNLDNNPKNLQVELYNTISRLNVTCHMATNSSNYSNYTPVVDYYILKLTGQTL